jgi:hypothetical protein
MGWSLPAWSGGSKHSLRLIAAAPLVQSAALRPRSIAPSVLVQSRLRRSFKGLIAAAPLV